MKPKFWGVISLIVCAMVVGTPSADASGGGQLYVAAGAYGGDANYMVLNPDGTFSDQEDMQLLYPYFASGGKSYGNGIGDFDNDGDLDYVTALGRLFRGDFKFYSNIYVFEKLDSADALAQFAYVIQEDNEPGGSSWTVEGRPGDMAVADFNGDGNLDFVLNLYGQPHCGLYLGDGQLGFDFQLLDDTTPVDSIGVDADDFNSDGKADFVIAPNDSTEPLYVYLGNGDGTFRLITSVRDTGVSPAYGIAAGDFVKDPDGIVDLAVSDTGVLEIYEGDGEGNFSLYKSTDVFALNHSSLDNIDFDSDGDPDLVAANYGDEASGVAVLELIDDQGNFAYAGTYLGGNSGARKSVAALPYLSNKKPVAVLTPETISVTVGEVVEWDASESFDEDGTIVSYEWDYGDGAVSPGVTNTLDRYAIGGNSEGPESSYVYFDSGRYTVTLTVTDDQGAVATVHSEVIVEALPVKVYFSPSKLNLHSRSRWITAVIIVPDGYDARMIAPDSIHLALEGQAEIKAHSVFGHGYFSNYGHKRSWRSRKLKAKFDRQALIDALDGATGNITLTVTGLISPQVPDMISSNVDYVNFSGAGTIKVYDKKPKFHRYRLYLLKQIMRFIFYRG